jgi:hypothetical protein
LRIRLTTLESRFGGGGSSDESLPKDLYEVRIQTYLTIAKTLKTYSELSAYVHPLDSVLYYYKDNNKFGVLVRKMTIKGYNAFICDDNIGGILKKE